MAVVASRRWKRPPLLIADPRLRLAVYAGALLYLALAISSVEVNWTRIYEGLERGLRFVQGFLAPDFITRSRDIWQGMVESLTMTLTSTVAGVLLSVPIGVGAARNIAPLPIYAVCRAIVAVSRSFQEIIVAILFVAMFGFIRARDNISINEEI